jgi:F-type H+-transporting ATPase subunit alpha
MSSAFMCHWPKASSIAGSVNAPGTRRYGYTIIVAATADSPQHCNTLLLYRCRRLAEYFMYNGRHTLAIYDDLQNKRKHIERCHCFSGVLGREAYPATSLSPLSTS